MVEFLHFAAEGILKKVASLAEQELGLLWGFKGDLTRLRDSLSKIQPMLRDAQQSQIQGETVEMWVKVLEDIGHDADDVLDEYGYEVLRRKVELQDQMKRKVLNFFSHHNPIAFRLKIAHKIQKINVSLANLKDEAASIGLVARSALADATSDDIAVDRDTMSVFDKDEKYIVGREEVVSGIVTTLINSSNNRENYLSVMAIVGMAGLGKTTLAKSIYHEYEIDRHFDTKIWICVSTPFKVKTILSGILEYLKPEKAGISRKAAIYKNLQDDLKGKRYLLILDDVWNEDPQKWDSLMTCLLNVKDTQGSNILVTTRNAIVASIVQTLPRHDLGKLTDDECWLILKDKAFPNGSAPLNEVEERVGREIAEKCAGVPLVAKVLGNMMCSRKSEEWESIVSSRIWDLPQGEERIMSVLKLSFDQLKLPSLKQCFAYCSTFFKDFDIQKDDLIQLWMAQGLLYPSSNRSNVEMEDIGEEYFNILLRNSFFQDLVKDDHGIITGCKMHDLVHDLAEHVSKSRSKDSNETRHMAAIFTSDLETIPKGSVHKLRSLFLNYISSIPNDPLEGLKGLRVLKLYYADIDELPISIGKLKHLRYLDVSRTKIKSLPKSIGKLYNLQTLRMHGVHVEEFPKEVRNLINLRHVYFDRSCMVFPLEMGRLTNLRSLTFFVVGKERGRGIEELAGLKQLTGELSIYGLQQVRDGEEAAEARLVEKKNLRKLSFEWEIDWSRAAARNNDVEVLEGLQPHPRLELLEILNFTGAKFPSWMTTSLFPELKTLTIRNAWKLIEWNEAGALPIVVFPCLEKLVLWNCDQLRSAPSHFASLKTLDICSMDSGMPLANISSKLTTLTSLTIGGIQGLNSLPEGLLRNNKNLAYLEIKDCPELTSIAVDVSGCCASLESLCISRCPNLRYSPYGLHPLSLKKLIIEHCNSLELIPVAHGLTSLYKLSIVECPRLSSLPQELEYCTSLQKFTIVDCPLLSRLPQGLEYCTSLQKLRISKCPEITFIPITHGFPSLRKLEISSCGVLSSLPSGLQYCSFLENLSIRDCNLKGSEIPSLPSLRWLYIEDCSLDHFPTLHSFTSLSVLSIRGFQGASLQIPVSVSLQVLYISDCPFLETILSLDNLAHFHRLEIYECHGLKNLPSGLAIGSSYRFTFLRELKIGGFMEELDSFPDFRVFPQLEELELRGWPKLNSLPEQVQHYTSLTRLEIWSFDGMEALPEWLRNLASLENLIIEWCKNLKYLPTVEAMKCLTKLKEIRFHGCYLLKRRCSKDNGPEWHKISHIPNITFDFVDYQQTQDLSTWMEPN